MLNVWSGFKNWITRPRQNANRRRHRISTLAAVELLEDRSLLSTVHFTVDPQQNQQAISRLIYGVNQSLSGDYSNNTFTRLGGNRWTAYNWENNASNAGSDYLYQNDSYLGGGTTPGGAVIPTLQDASAHNAGALITVPINGYVSADKNGGGDVRNSGSNYLQTRFRQEVAHKGSAFSLTPDLTDPYVYQDEFVNWVATNFPYGQTDPNRPIYFSLDNEPDLWASTHAEVHPSATTYAELVQKTIDFADAIKDVAPNSKVFGPVNYGWHGFTTLQDAPDGAGRDFQSFYLQQLAQAEVTTGHRLVDALDVHWYPEAQGGGVRITGQETTDAVVAARLQAPRSLWDPTYTETSWITQWSTFGPINLLPRLQGKIATNYAGTKLAITEYNYGGGAHISGGIAQADVLGILGRDGVFAANEWPLAANESFIGGAFEMFRNFDGNNGTFGDTSVSASTDDVASSSIYASVDAANPNVFTLIAINKTAQPLSSIMQLAHVSPNATASIYQLTSANSNPQSAGSVVIADPANFNYTMPAYSVSTIRIVSPSGPPALSVNSVSVTEGNTGTTTAHFTVTLSPAASGPVTVNYATANGTAIAGSDYTSASGTLSFAAGETSKTIDVLVQGDTQAEPDETFTLSLSNPSGAGLGVAQGTGTILNDDLPGLAIGNATITEGNSGSATTTFTVTLSQASTQTVTVQYATANGTATAGSDYTATSGTLTFTAGQTSKTVTVSVTGDLLDESDETFVMNLSGATNAVLAPSQGTCTIVDDDATPSLRINDVSVTERTGRTVNAVFTVTLSAASGLPVTVNYAPANDTATAPADFTLLSGALTFAAGQTSKTITVTIVGDALDEVNETYFVNLTSPANATLADGQGLGTIIDDDAMPSLRISDATVTEGTGNAVYLVFTVTLSAASSLPVTVNYATANGTATSGSDYTAASGMLTFAAGDTSKTISILIFGDSLHELSETLYINLSGALNATIADSQGKGTIKDNDP